ncbi:MAG: diguanylate cyclase [Planctomycetota bacterium]
MQIPTVKNIEHIAKSPDNLLTIKENTTVAEAARKMSDNHIGCLVVFDAKDKFIGVLSERDMLSKVLATSLSPDNVLVKDIMTTKPISCKMEASISEAEQLMAEHKIRHIPIIEKGKPIGMVSSRDLIAYYLNSSIAMKTAAEQLAMLSTGLKSLELEDVVALAINEVPKSFEADLAVLCFTDKAPSAPMVYRNACSVPEKCLLNANKKMKPSKNDQVTCSDIWPECKNHNGQSPRILIPLSIYNQAKKRGGSNHTRHGFLCMCRFNPSQATSDDTRLYKASLLQEVLNANLTSAQLYQNYLKARRDSEIDPLTDVGTRRFLEQTLRTEYARAIRYNHTFCVAIIDIDHFKDINDSKGHPAGDKALKAVAKIIHESIRSTDIPARYGGDEFVLLLPETQLKEAMIMLERLREQVKNISIPNVPPISISCGVAEWSGSPADTAEMLLKRADVALYEAKHKGRNRVASIQQP